MVLFINVNVGQRVEVLYKGDVHLGTVRYKGGVVNRRGDWVGVDLDKKAGKHNGTVRGSRYFQCREGHGIFTQAQHIRFIPMKRCMFNRYHTVEPEEEFAEEDLFNTSPRPDVRDSPYDPIRISRSYSEDATELFPERHVESYTERRRSHHLSHSVGNTMPAATMRRPYSAMAQFTYTSAPIHHYTPGKEPFCSTPTIPKIHMPHSALKRQVRRGWTDSHYVREMSVNTGREGMKFSQWNDTSA
ncbi:unnamed protein product [Owenia fusiformis]|uniref:Uncharacterized protein n=1 Tax=Owenia fusiformis TaxID=6347 RepID=A0A8J1TH18_OWEFU|nr:unnamed protein product [Owenia fusiformis]